MLVYRCDRCYAIKEYQLWSLKCKKPEAPGEGNSELSGEICEDCARKELARFLSGYAVTESYRNMERKP